METRIAVKTTAETRRALKLIAALTGETQYAALERLVLVEIARLLAERNQL